MIKAGSYLSERYEVLERIGSGGMADVYRGKDHKLNRYVAIKVLKREYREDESFVRKFQSEAQAAAGLLHPNVVNVYDVGRDRGLYYMVMELVEGITLKEYIEKKGALSTKEVLSIAIQMCSGIEAAHSHHIVHRDIKPQNIIISKEGKVKVTDFGIAKAVSSNTISSNAMGSVHYTSPEQARGGFSDEKSDIYSVGITMYEMATGRVPFDGESTVSIALKHLQETIVPPSEYVPSIPRALEQIILKCTQKSPEGRYPNTTLLIMDLKRALTDPNGNFVKMGSAARPGTETIVMSPGELDRIKREYADDDYDDDDYDDDDYDDDDYDDDDYDDDDYDEDDYDDRRRSSGTRRRRGSREEDDDVNPRMAKMMKILTIVVAVIIVFILIFIVGKATGLFKFGPGSSVEQTAEDEAPKLLGLTEQQAKDSCEKAGYKLVVAGEKESDTYPEGQVCEQSPSPGGKAEKGSEITVYISSGLTSEKPIAIPNVIGEDQDAAEKMLREAGFSAENINVQFENNDQYENGKVFKVEPEGQATAADQITIWVSTGEELVDVPGVTGQSLANAKKMLSSAKLSVGTTTEEYDDTVAAGNIISQSVKKGKKVEAGTQVNLVVSKGPKPEEKVSVPNVSGVSLSSAKKTLANYGFTNVTSVEEGPSDLEAGLVIRTEPSAGSSVSTSTKITIVVSTGPEDWETDE